MKLRIFGAVIFTAIAITTGWNFSQSQSKVKLSDLVLANVEALANGESGGSITGNCNSSFVVTTECKAVCICGTAWYPSPRVPKAVAANVSGTCPKCGSTHWNAYN